MVVGRISRWVPEKDPETVVDVVYCNSGVSCIASRNRGVSHRLVPEKDPETIVDVVYCNSGVSCIASRNRGVSHRLVPEKDPETVVDVVYCNSGVSCIASCNRGVSHRLVPEKDPETFVRAAALVAAHHAGVVFRLWGDGPERGRLEALAANLSLGSRLLTCVRHLCYYRPYMRHLCRRAA